MPLLKDYFLSFKYCTTHYVPGTRVMNSSQGPNSIENDKIASSAFIIGTIPCIPF
jgi:hypothetical protein